MTMKKRPPLSIKTIRESTKNIGPAVQLVWHADPKNFSILALITLTSSVIPISQALVARWIVDTVLIQANAHATMLSGLKAVGPYFFAEFGLIIYGVLAGQYRKYASEILNQNLSQSIATQIMLSASRLDIHSFEDPSFLDKLQSARQETKFRAMGLVNSGFLVIQNILTLISFAAPIVALNPLMAVILFSATFPSFVAQTSLSRLSFRLHSWRAPEGRKMGYYEQLLTSDTAAKEVRIFQLAPSLLARHSQLFSKVFVEDRRLAARKSMASVFWGSVASLSFYVCYGWIIIKTIARTLTLGQMTFYLASFRQLQATFQGLFDNINSIYENGLFMENLFSVLQAQGRVQVSAALSSVASASPTAPNSISVPVSAVVFGAKPAEQMPQIDFTAGIEFRDVSFKYPNKEAWALRHFNLRVEPGQTIALVGENGSGKTTLIKLLTRLYRPTEGQIILFGRDLALFEEAELYRLFSAIFQDFVQYQSTARDNVGFGAIEQMDDEDRFIRAAVQGGATDIVSGFGDGWETMLGSWFKGAQQLSGGQWQRIALSRAFMRNPEILILDEPTSALDAENEQNVFNRLKQMAKGKISFLVSHRFSTVRMADQIVVLHKGQVGEVGTHDQLMRAGREYARLFDLQAQGYR